ncbi:HIT domain-containing protein [Paraburkholderia sp. C35]|uniref:HIT family protein n=1 Tax=Paraburkholderia sp. C35 TaxID=2126993 RepID=UPI001EF6FCF8|nr:HIT domain-containing protein [Paraburkholderia sp. C35]
MDSGWVFHLPGHSLIIPKRHVRSFFDVNTEERDDLLTLLDDAKAYALASVKPDGFNIGINDGPAAGQTVPHLHIHLIPPLTGNVVAPWRHSMGNTIKGRLLEQTRLGFSAPHHRRKRSWLSSRSFNDCSLRATSLRRKNSRF